MNQRDTKKTDENSDEFDYVYVYIPAYQNLSEDFIKELNKIKLVDVYIPAYQKLSEDFIKELNKIKLVDKKHE